MAHAIQGVRVSRPLDGRFPIWEWRLGRPAPPNLASAVWMDDPPIHACVLHGRCNSSPSGLWHPHPHPPSAAFFQTARLGPFVPPPQHPGTVASATCHSSWCQEPGTRQETTSDGIGYRRSSARLCGARILLARNTTAFSDLGQRTASVDFKRPTSPGRGLS